MKCHEEMQHRNAAQTVVELCAIRDGVSDCDTLSYNDVCNLIDLFLRPCLCYQLQSIEQNMYVLL